MSTTHATWPRQLTRSWRAGAEALERFDRKKERALRVAPDFYDLEFTELTLRTADDVELGGWFVPAKGPPGLADVAVLMHHHFGGQKAALLPWIELFHQLGVSCLAFDARGHGSSPCRWQQESYRQRFADVRAARAELLRRGARRLLLYAQSQGGAVVLGGLADSREIAGVILDSGPALSATASIWGLARTLPAQDTPVPAAAASAISLELLRRTWPSSYALHLWRGLLHVRHQPLLWLYGSADQIIPPAWSQWWFSPMSQLAPRWERLQVEGASHAECLQHGGAQVQRRIARFVGQLAVRP